MSNGSMDVSYAMPDFSKGGKSPGSSNNPYLATLIDPAEYSCRIPDEFSNQTALYCSRTYLDVYGNTNPASGAPNLGKFSFYIRPVLGHDDASPTYIMHNSIIEVKSTAVWQTINWNEPVIGAYFQSSNDPNFVQMIKNHNGLVREIRPVAMSAWFQFTAPSLTLGGHVGCALTDGQYDWYNNDGTLTGWPAGTPLQEYRNLSLLPNSYNGKITEGCYAFYKPFDQDDIIFRNYQGGSMAVNYGANHTYPAIVISGQVISTAAPYSGIIGRIQVDTVYEYVTYSRLVQSLPSPVCPELVWNARQALQTVKTCMANDEHKNFFSKVLDFGKKLISKAAPVVGSIAGELLGGPAGAAVGNRIGSSISKFVQPGTSTPSGPKAPSAAKRPTPKKKKSKTNARK